MQVLTGVGVKAVHAAERTVELADGRRVPADLVLFSVGVRPELTLRARRRAGDRPVGRAAGRRSPAHLRPGHLRRRRHGGGHAQGLGPAGARAAGRPGQPPGPHRGLERAGAGHALPRRARHQRGEDLRGHRRHDRALRASARARRASRSASRSSTRTTTPATTRAPRSSRSSSSTTGRPRGCSAPRPSARPASTSASTCWPPRWPGKLTLHDLAELDLAYAPPYSSANDPVNLAAFVGLERHLGLQPAGHRGGAQGRARLARAAARARRAHPGEYGASHLRGARPHPGGRPALRVRVACPRTGASSSIAARASARTWPCACSRSAASRTWPTSPAAT